MILHACLALSLLSTPALPIEPDVTSYPMTGAPENGYFPEGPNK